MEKKKEDISIPVKFLPGDQNIEENELDFPRPLTDVLEKPISIFATILKSVVDLFLSLSFQLSVTGVVSIICIVAGSIYLSLVGTYRMLCIAFIVQGSSSLFVVCVHTCAIIFK